MERVGIVVDSGADLPAELAREAGISTVPLSIRFGDEEYLDRVTMSLDDFWSRVATSTQLPSTAAPSPGAYLDEVRRRLDEGFDSIVIVTLSSRLSASYQSAVVAAEELSDVAPVRVLDSLSATMGQGLVALRMAHAAREGASLDEVVVLGESARRRVGVIGMLDSLEHLVKGGRIGSARALVGSILSIKPLLSVREGVVCEAGRHRTPARALAAIVNEVSARRPLDYLCVVHARSTLTSQLSSRLEAESLDVPLFSAAVGPTIGTHAGPGLIGVAWLEGEPH